MEEQSSLILPKELTQKYQDAIRMKLNALMRSTGINQSQLVSELERRGISYNQGNLSQFLSGKKNIQLGVIVHLCDIYKISLAELVDENFGGARCISGGRECGRELYTDDLLLQVPDLGDAFVTDPSSPEFHGYLQTYHIYLKATQSDDQKLMTGTLTLEASGSVCEASLRLNTNKIVDGKPIFKSYSGRVIISKAIDAVYILLTSPVEGELSVISFRHFHLPHQPLDCRVAAVLTNSAGEYHSPTMHRMFLSRTEIAPEHLPLLIPHLYLNTNEICIRREQLDLLRQESPQYADVIDHLTYRFEPVDTYFWGEDYVLGMARLFLTRDQRQHFLSRVRDLSVREYVNKASRRADLLTHDLLLSLGYFRDHDM